MRNELGIVKRKETKKNKHKQKNDSKTNKTKTNANKTKQTNKKSSKRINLIERLMLEFPYIKVRKIFRKHKRVPRLEFFFL